jgi:hypothetical protein
VRVYVCVGLWVFVYVCVRVGVCVCVCIFGHKQEVAEHDGRYAREKIVTVFRQG